MHVEWHTCIILARKTEIYVIDWMNVMQEKASPYLKIYIQLNTCTCIYLQIFISESRRIVSNVIKKTTLHQCRSSLHPGSFYSPFCRPYTEWRSCSGVDSRRGAPAPSSRPPRSDSRSETAENRSRSYTHSMITETEWYTFLRIISNEIHAWFFLIIKTEIYTVEPFTPFLFDRFFISVNT